MESRKQLLIKSYTVAIVMVLLGIAIMFRLIQIQSGDVEKYKELAAKTNFRKVTIEASRGNLYASDGALLATTVLKYNIYMDLKTVDQDLFDQNVHMLADSLSQLVNKPSNSIAKKLIREKKLDNQYLPIALNLDFKDFERIKNFPIFSKGKFKGGFIVERKTKRIHPITGFGDRTLGFDDYRGKAGLEGAFREFLRGENGQQLEQFINGKYWKPINYWHQDNIDPVNGNDVYTTIDMRLQDIAYSALQKQLIQYEADHGCAIVMEVKTGKILALTNLTKTENGEYKDTRNYAVWEASEPGSTFKVPAMLAALDDGYVDQNTTIDIGKGRWRVNNREVVDDHGSGVLTISEILSQSSNVGIAKIIFQHYKTNPENFVNKLYQWGLNDKIDIEIPGESQPLIPHPIKNPTRWSKTALPWMSFGYNVKLTPLQLLTFYNAIANNGVEVKPRMLEKIESEGKIIKQYKTEVLRQNIGTNKSRKLLIDMLIEAVDQGTAKSIFTPNLSMAGKTGTAQVEYWKKGPRQYQASFCGFFPGNNPQYSCIVVINKPNTKIGFYGSQVAAPVFKEIAGKVFLKTPLNIPSEVKNLPNFHIKNNFEKTKTFTLNENEKYLPNLVGYYAKDVIPVLENRGIKVRYKGVGKILNQSLTEGYLIKKGITLYLELQ